jgi:hypothetical protein
MSRLASRFDAGRRFFGDNDSQFRKKCLCVESVPGAIPQFSGFQGSAEIHQIPHNGGVFL